MINTINSKPITKPTVKPTPIVVKTAKTPQLITKYDVPLPKSLINYTVKLCKKYKVRPSTIFAIMKVESDYNVSCISDTHDYGIMQINRCHLEWLSKDFKINKIMDPRQNIKAGIIMFSTGMKKFNSTNKALMVYNLGEGQARRLWNKGFYSSRYSRKVLKEAERIRGY